MQVNNIVLEANKIRKSYDGKTDVLKEIDLTVKEGEFISIMGPSGSGKSTLLYSISTLDSINSGKNNLLGVDTVNLKEESASDFRRNKMGFIFQNTAFISNLSILDNILLPTLGDSKKKETIERAESLMKDMGIENLKTRRVEEVSGGQLQRAAIVRALINSPKILFADEPTGALNSKTSEEIIEVLNTLNKKGMTIILVTHDAKVAAGSSRVLFLKDGKISEDMNMTNIESDMKLKKVREVMDVLGI